MLKVVVVSLLVSCGAFAAESKVSLKSSSEGKSTSKELKKDSSKKKMTQKEREALSQGYSASEALLMGSKRWNAVVSQSFSRGIDEFDDALISNTALNYSYRINKKSALVLYGEFDTIAYRQDGELFNNEDADKRRFGLSDLILGYSRPNIWKGKKQNINYFGRIALPTSFTAQDATTIASVRNSFVYRYRPTGKLILLARALMDVNAHELDTADEFGFVVNSPFAVGWTAGASYRILSQLIAVANYSNYYRLNYNDDWDTIQTISFSMNYNVTAVAALFAGYTYRDRVVTNDDLFDDDRGLYFTGVSYAF